MEVLNTILMVIGVIGLIFFACVSIMLTITMLCILYEDGLFDPIIELIKRKKEKQKKFEDVIATTSYSLTTDGKEES